MSGRTIGQVYSTGITLTNGTDNPVTVLSSGTIAVTGTGSVALQAPASTYWTIGNAGSIDGYSAGVSLAGGGSLVNTGTIGASQTASPGYSYNTSTSNFTPISGGVVMAGGGVSNASSATISGVFEAVALGGGGSVANAGLIQGGAKYFGIVLPAGGSVSNAASGTISAGREGVLALGTASTVTNAGQISASGVFGVFLVAGGSVSNSGSAVIQGGVDGVVAKRNASTLTNQGTITGSRSIGAILTAGGYVSNAGGSTITGEFFGSSASPISRARRTTRDPSPATPRLPVRVALMPPVSVCPPAVR